MKASDEVETAIGSTPVLSIPPWFRIVAGVIGLAMLWPSLSLLYSSWSEPDKFSIAFTSAISHLMIVGAVVLLAAAAPWNGLGLRLRKVGFLEFDRVINNQSRERIEDFAEILARIDELEAQVRRQSGVAPIVEHFAELDLNPLLTKFLEAFRPRAFSPLRIRQWGARQPGFEGLAKYSQGNIRTVLQKLAGSGCASTRVSRLGNTLYKSPD